MRRTDATDWNRYYEQPCPAASLTRRFTAGRLLNAITRHAPHRAGGLVLAELGGGASCCHDLLLKRLRPARYHVVDNNTLGLELLPRHERIERHQFDLRQGFPDLRADVVFSLGLIEHFDPADTARVIQAHFDLAAPDGLVVMTFPTPTGVYRLARAVAEALGLWMFKDERPLTLAEVAATAGVSGELAQVEVLWPVVFTQALMALKVCGQRPVPVPAPAPSVPAPAGAEA
ncbi:MAG: class I SAM-dependent methyltransferase [Pseudomonadota bacterium]